jgi:hypothetical protein
MKKILYVNGCSHACGAEISYVGSHREPQDLKKSWAGKLASKYKLIHHNDALSGQGNESIYSNSVNSILKLLDTYSPEEIFVILGWSGFERTNFIYENISYRFVPGCQELEYFPKWPKIVRNAFNNWIISVDFKNAIMNKTAMLYFSMKQFLEINKIEYYFINTVHSYVMPEQDLMHELDFNRINYKLFDILKSDVNYLEPFNNDMAYYQYMKVRYNGHIGGRNHHFLEDAQEEWAELIDEKIGYRLV